MNPSAAAAAALVHELVRQDVADVVLAPGSRSAPLAFALAAAARDGRLRLHVRIDERVAAFTALGMSRVAGPVAVVTTSGTAVANLHPAVLEAAHSRLPLLVLTADRPHELRGTGANQTTDQVRIFGTAVRFFADVPAPDGRAGELTDHRQLLVRALVAATGAGTGMPGPIHLNLSYREPLVPGSVDDTDLGRAASVGALMSAAGSAPADNPADNVAGTVRTGGTGMAWGGDLRRAADTGQRYSGYAGSVSRLEQGPRTVVIAGDGAGPDARRCAEDGGFPLLAEPSSGARGGVNAIGPYRLLLDQPALGPMVERAVVFGHPTLSRPVNALLARPDVEVVVVAPGGGGGDWPDPARNAAHVTPAVEAEPPVDLRWLDAWRGAAERAREAIDLVLATEPLCGPAVAREMWSARRAGELLVVGSSNPIRDLDLTAVPDPPDRQGDDGAVIANRGLSGIDGTLSTAGGLAVAAGRLTRALVGDLTFLHDAGGLLTGPLEDEPGLQIVVVNDDGGGIFTLLEQGAPEYADTFERVFGTPHGADLAALCRGYGVAHQYADGLASLRAALHDPPPGRSVVEIQSERARLPDLHARLRAAVADAVSAGL